MATLINPSVAHHIELVVPAWLSHHPEEPSPGLISHSSSTQFSVPVQSVSSLSSGTIILISPFLPLFLLFSLPFFSAACFSRFAVSPSLWWSPLYCILKSTVISPFSELLFNLYLASHSEALHCFSSISCFVLSHLLECKPCRSKGWCLPCLLVFSSGLLLLWERCAKLLNLKEW